MKLKNLVHHEKRLATISSSPLASIHLVSAVQSAGGKVTMASMELMPLMKSIVYESLRIKPPVPLQYARAKRDFVIESHSAAFATKDPKIFDRADEFVPKRFIGEGGEKLLKHVL
ncbi:allene oxide synthase 1, chloroplastic-like [Olea europaea subsp. europaea]|uniref:Allene oxide synthase 1, chloroplastic-like n=1 Tax=Olea europaea subsp. europaea TaxID=158383 RepID=A0A8S0TZ47_OLEEU|nr:allene oxide synthase 1, chloroplastic-like [Olea europaea subsp. europaea]